MAKDNAVRVGAGDSHSPSSQDVLRRRNYAVRGRAQHHHIPRGNHDDI